MTMIPPHFSPGQREALERADSCWAWNSLFEIRCGDVICRDKRALIAALGTIRQSDLDRLLAELAAQLDRVAAERARWADFDPEAELNAERARGAMEAAAFQRSAEGRQIALLERIVELLEREPSR